MKIFKTHFATLDIRQNHTEHESVITQILKNGKWIKNSLAELSEQDLVSILVHEQITVQPDQFEEEIIKDTIQTILQIKIHPGKKWRGRMQPLYHQQFRRYFRSTVRFLRCCGGAAGKTGKYRSISFLCLNQWTAWRMPSPSCGRCLIIPEYRSHVRFREDRQTIMLGFSDGTKDGGYLQANWSIFKTKEALTAVCDQNHVKAVFFDGRGGPPARGGGKAHQFYASQGRRIANHAIQLTIQGQTITSQYGTRSQFIHQCEQLLTAGLSPGLSENRRGYPGKIAAAYRTDGPLEP